LTERAEEAYALTSPLVRRGYQEIMTSSVWVNLLGVHAWTSCETGRWEEATTVAAQVIEGSSFNPHKSSALATLVRLHCRRDQLDLADDLASAALPAPTPTMDEAVQMLFDVVWTPAHVRLEIAAHRDDLDTVRRNAELVWSHPRAPWREGLGRHTLLITARALLGRGNPDPGDLESLRQARALMGAVTDETPAWSAELDTLTRHASGEDLTRSWHRVVGLWSANGQAYDVAHARLHLARALASQAADRAQEQLVEALTLAEELGADWLTRRIRRTGQALGLRVPRSSDRAASPGPLTAREHEVLVLVTEGRTNEEIAAALFMSPKTASVHVSRIIAKLGVRNRTEAARTLRHL
jgi:DNA-binding CsgD family transcriptional regulator